MHKFMGDTHGISVVVGAMMLTLIVVTAATTYAIFLSEQQKKLQDAESLEQQRALENITILSITPSYNSPTLGNVSFVVSNLNAAQTIITTMNINNNYVRAFNITRQNGNKENYTMPYDGTGKRPILYPREQVTITVNISHGDAILFKNITKSDAITLHIFTSLTNDFSKTFYPPTAIIKIETEYLLVGSNYLPFYILDGSESNQPSDGYIIKWKWNVSDITNLLNMIYANPEPNGQKTQITDPTFIFGTIGNTYRVNLTVTDNFGMEGISTFLYKP